MRGRFDQSIGLVYQVQARFLCRGLTMAVFHSSQNSPVVRDRLTIWIIVGREASSICLRVLVGMMSNSQCLFFMFIMTVHASVSVSGCEDENLRVSCCAGLYNGMFMNFSLIFSIFDRKNLVKCFASSSSVLLGGKGFCVVLPISLLTRWKSFGHPSHSPRLSY